jgi:hypothetical protein
MREAALSQRQEGSAERAGEGRAGSECAPRAATRRRGDAADRAGESRAGGL